MLLKSILNRIQLHHGFVNGAARANPYLTTKIIYRAKTAYYIKKYFPVTLHSYILIVNLPIYSFSLAKMADQGHRKAFAVLTRQALTYGYAGFVHLSV